MDHLPIKPLNKRYHIVSDLGNGSFGSVVLAKRREAYVFEHEKMNTLMNPISGISDLANPLVAIKTMNKKLEHLKDYNRVKEVKFILSIASHPNLVFIHEMFIDDSCFKLHIVMETMNQNLYQFIKARKNQLFSINTVKSILTQLLAAIRHIHRFGYFHRDVKPENILITPNNNYNGYKAGYFANNVKDFPYIVKLADYGLARSVTNKKPFTAYVSTRWYRSPEILLRQKHYSTPIDIWAFGCVAVEVATFRPLFPGSNELDQIWKILEVLGTPHGNVSSSTGAVKNLGGQWSDAKVLASNLGFQLPYVRGARLNDLIPRPELLQLLDCVKQCLTWDPCQRINVENLSQMPFFKESINSLYNVEASFNFLPSLTLKNLSANENSGEPITKSVNSKPSSASISTNTTTNTQFSMNSLKISPLNSPISSSSTRKQQQHSKQKSLLLKKSANQLSPISYNFDNHGKSSHSHMPTHAAFPPPPVPQQLLQNVNMNVSQNAKYNETFKAYHQYYQQQFQIQQQQQQHHQQHQLHQHQQQQQQQAFQLPPLQIPAMPQMTPVPQVSQIPQVAQAPVQGTLYETPVNDTRVNALRNSYYNYSSSIGSEEVESEFELNRLISQKQLYYPEEIALKSPIDQAALMDEFINNENFMSTRKV